MSKGLLALALLSCLAAFCTAVSPAYTTCKSPNSVFGTKNGKDLNGVFFCMNVSSGIDKVFRRTYAAKYGSDYQLPGVVVAEAVNDALLIISGFNDNLVVGETPRILYLSEDLTKQEVVRLPMPGPNVFSTFDKVVDMALDYAKDIVYVAETHSSTDATYVLGYNAFINSSAPLVNYTIPGMQAKVIAFDATNELLHVFGGTSPTYSSSSGSHGGTSAYASVDLKKNAVSKLIPVPIYLQALSFDPSRGELVGLQSAPAPSPRRRPHSSTSSSSISASSGYSGATSTGGHRSPPPPSPPPPPAPPPSSLSVYAIDPVSLAISTLSTLTLPPYALQINAGHGGSPFFLPSSGTRLVYLLTEAVRPYKYTGTSGSGSGSDVGAPVSSGFSGYAYSSTHTGNHGSQSSYMAPTTVTLHVLDLDTGAQVHEVELTDCGRETLIFPMNYF